jgi:excisionase family DNA binding protein
MDSGKQLNLLTVAEVASILHVSKAHISNIVAGRVRGCQAIPAIRLGRRTLIRRESLLLWCEQQDKIATSPEEAAKTLPEKRRAYAE